MDSTVRPLQRAGGVGEPKSPTDANVPDGSRKPSHPSKRASREEVVGQPLFIVDPVSCPSCLGLGRIVKPVARRERSHTYTTKEPEDGEVVPQGPFVFVSGQAFKSDSQLRQFSVLARRMSTVETPGSSTTSLHVGRGSDVAPGPLSPRATTAATEGPTSAPRSQRLEPTAPMDIDSGVLETGCTEVTTGGPIMSNSVAALPASSPKRHRGGSPPGQLRLPGIQRDPLRSRTPAARDRLHHHRRRRTAKPTMSRTYRP
ncbi:hypothetical protein GEV33_007386 [Tenebrio molitor]|uniref:Uncharacterized protein n=1 Tax=Tenebrio molitor TaxID=7067 RepID=A0A8J6LIW0_TENMO|nr:hypothetical protein GEV33_007386 [Tenebrio molitor]